MAKLYFKYGAMGSSKSAQALITKFNYEERGLKVWLIKPSVDTRMGLDTVASRIGLKAKCTTIHHDTSIWEEFENRLAQKVDVIIADESQFFTSEQIDDMRRIVDELEVLTAGLSDSRIRRRINVVDDHGVVMSLCNIKLSQKNCVVKSS